MIYLQRRGVAQFSVLSACLAVFSAAGGCSSSSTPAGDTSGAGGAAKAGASSGAGATSRAGAGNAAGATSLAGAAGNVSGAGAAGTAGTPDGVGGLAGNGGDTALGGSGGTAGMGPLFPNCTPIAIPVSDTLITDFSVPGNSFGNYTNNLSSTLYTFAAPVVGDTSAGDWHITGTVSGVSSMVFGLICKYDVSAFTGIQFDIKGSFSPVVGGDAGGTGGTGGASGAGGTTGASGSGGAGGTGGRGGTGGTGGRGGAAGAGGRAGAGGSGGAGGRAGAGGSGGVAGGGGATSYGGAAVPQVSFRVSSAPDDVDSAHASVTTWGTCVPATGNQYDGTCATPFKVIPLTTLPVTQTVHWSDLTGGRPRPQPDPTQITQISWGLPWNGTGPAYTIDITIDNVMFTTN